MFGGHLNKDAFISLVCQQSRSGRGVDSRWVCQMLCIVKSTAIKVMADLEKEGTVTKTEIPWRTNAKKFYYYPTDRAWKDYHAKLYRAGYLSYMRAMMRA